MAKALLNYCLRALSLGSHPCWSRVAPEVSSLALPGLRICQRGCVGLWGGRREDRVKTQRDSIQVELEKCWSKNTKWPPKLSEASLFWYPYVGERVVCTHSFRTIETCEYGGRCSATAAQRKESPTVPSHMKTSPRRWPWGQVKKNTKEFDKMWARTFSGQRPYHLLQSGSLK